MEALSTLKLRLLHAGHASLGTEWQYNAVISPFCRLYLVTEGSAWVWHNHIKFDLLPGNLYLIPSFSYGRYYCDNTMTQYYLSILEETENGLSAFDILTFAYQVPATEIDRLLFQRLLVINPGRGIQNSDPKMYDNQSGLLSFNQPNRAETTGFALETQGILLQLFSRFVLIPSETTLQQSRVQLNKVLTYIHMNLAEKITIEHLAKMQNLNADHFSRQFQTTLGIRPSEYIINKRLERAQFLMMTSCLTLQEITEQIGISDIYYFSRLFKRRFGVSPGRYRRFKN